MPLHIGCSKSPNIDPYFSSWHDPHNGKPLNALVDLRGSRQYPAFSAKLNF
jgi:hypothetical protein